MIDTYLKTRAEKLLKILDPESPEFEVQNALAGNVDISPSQDPANTEDETVYLDDMTVAQLKAYAKENNYDLGDAKSKQEIIDAIVDIEIDAAESEE